MKIIRYSFLLLLLLLLTACGKDEVTKVNVGEVTRSIFYAPLYAAVEQGFFEDEGKEYMIVRS